VRIRFSKTPAEMRELAVARAADVVRDVESVLLRGLRTNFDASGASAAFVSIASSAYTRALHGVMMEHAVPVDDDAAGGPGAPVDASWLFDAQMRGASSPAGRVVDPHPFLPVPRRPEQPATCAVCEQDEHALVHHPELIAGSDLGAR
jgi:hypothetical protein